MYQALVDKLKALVSDGTVVAVLEGFDGIGRDEYPVIYVDMVGSTFEAVTANKDEIRVDVAVEIETFDEVLEEAKKSIRSLAETVRSKIVEDYSLGGAVDTVMVESKNFEMEVYPDGYLCRASLTVSLVRWLF